MGNEYGLVYDQLMSVHAVGESHEKQINESTILTASHLILRCFSVKPIRSAQSLQLIFPTTCQPSP